jgi:hypothetical protein
VGVNVGKTRTRDPVERLEQLVTLVYKFHVLMFANKAVVVTVVIHRDYRVRRARMAGRKAQAKRKAESRPIHPIDPGPCSVTEYA